MNAVVEQQVERAYTPRAGSLVAAVVAHLNAAPGIEFETTDLCRVTNQSIFGFGKSLQASVRNGLVKVRKVGRNCLWSKGDGTAPLSAQLIQPSAGRPESLQFKHHLVSASSAPKLSVPLASRSVFDTGLSAAEAADLPPEVVAELSTAAKAVAEESKRPETPPCPAILEAAREVAARVRRAPEAVVPRETRSAPTWTARAGEDRAKFAVYSDGEFVIAKGDEAVVLTPDELVTMREYVARHCA